MQKVKLQDFEIAIIVAHTMRRFMSNFKPHERNSTFEKVLKRLTKMLLQRERTNTAAFINATEYERELWLKATGSYDGSVPIFAVDFVCSVYEYFEKQMHKHANLNPKLMEKMNMIHNTTEVDSKTAHEIEKNDSDLLSTYIKLFEKDSGVALKKSLFGGKKLILKNNLIIEGKELVDDFR